MKYVINLLVRIVKYLYRIIKKILVIFIIRPYKNKRREYAAKYININISELFMQQNLHSGYNRLDIIVRYLAVENYYGKNDCGFAMYEKMQGKRGKIVDIHEGIKRFKELIASWEKDGYKEDSYITVDKNLMLYDGSHRIAYGLYHDVDFVPCKVYSDSYSVKFGIQWFIENGFTTEEISIITGKCDELIKKHMQPVVCNLWPPVHKYFAEITEKLSLLADGIEYEDYIFNDIEFESITKNIYRIDDIADWKVAKKLDRMADVQPKTIRVLKLYTAHPDFRLKTINNNTISQTGETIKKVIRNAYKERVSDYLYDIIIHTGDNYLHGNKLSALFEKLTTVEEE